eukprot:scaffold42792_cov34-Tisochrysis_lutea.AAC.3
MWPPFPPGRTRWLSSLRRCGAHPSTGHRARGVGRTGQTLSLRDELPNSKVDGSFSPSGNEWTEGGAECPAMGRMGGGGGTGYVSLYLLRALALGNPRECREIRVGKAPARI